MRYGQRAPRTVLVFWALVACVAIPGIIRLEIETSTDSVLDRSSRQWDFYQQSLDKFGGDEVISILIPAAEPFGSDVLQIVEDLTAQIEDIPGVWRVDSLSTVPLVRENIEGDLRLDSALGDSDYDGSSGHLAYQRLVESDSLAPKMLVSSDGMYFAINVVLQGDADKQYDEVLPSIGKLLEGYDAAISGVPIFRVETDRWTRSELVKFVPITALAIALLMAVLYWGNPISLLPIISSGIGSAIVLSVMGLSGTPLTISTVILPSVLIALGCAYSMHFLTAYQASLSDDDLTERLSAVATPVALSGLTTSIGFLAIGFVPIESIRNVAVFGALGVLVVLTITLTVVPAMLQLLPQRSVDTAFRRWASGSFSSGLVALCLNNRRRLLLAWCAAGLVTLVGLFALSVETDVILWFPKSHQIRSDYDHIREKLSGISPVNIVIDAPRGKSISSPDVVAALGEFSRYLESLDSVGKAISMASPLGQIHKLVAGDSAGEYPSSREGIEQSLLLLESSDYMSNLITEDRGSANVSLRVNQNGSAALLDVAARAESWWRSHGVPGYSATSTGIMFEFARSQHAIATGQIRGLLFVFVSIAVIVYAAFRRVDLAIAALLANVVPIAMGFGLMGLLGIPIDAGTVVVGCIAFGIGIDDTIHTATRFTEACLSGATNSQAIAIAYKDVLPAVMFTTMVTSVGFLVLGLSQFALIRNLGLVTSVVMLLCFLADAFLFPVLLASVGRGNGNATGRHVETS